MFQEPVQDDVLIRILRDFMTDIADLTAGVELVNHKTEIVRFLKLKMDVFTPKERYRIYGFMEGMFKEGFEEILAIRLAAEKDTKCLELLHAISELHSES